MEQSLMDKLTILADSAKYDVACTSSGASHPAKRGTIGSCYAPGCCHAFTADGRCVSLLKVLMSNCCAFDCSYCVNRKSNDVPRATFSPRELAELTIEFYRRNYIEGLFLSSAVLGTPDYTTERMLTVLRLLRNEYHFGGYIHAKTIPGTSPELIQQMGYLADRLSVNVELPSEQSLHLLAPDKGRHSIFRPMKQISVAGEESRQELTLYRHAPKFAPAGQSTQMIVGASPETDYHILQLSEGMYQKYGLKRVFYSAYIPVLPVQGRRDTGSGQPELQPLSRPEMQLGRPALRAVPGGREPCPLRDAAAGAGHRPQERPPHPGRPAAVGPRPRRAETHGRGAQAGAVFHHLPGLFRGAPGPGQRRTGAHHPGAHRPQRLQRRGRAAEYVRTARR